MISLLLPSRGRPESLRRLISSGELLKGRQGAPKLEWIVRLDDDDPFLGEYLKLKDERLGTLTFLVGPRDVLSKYWNECFSASHGDIFMHCGDDIIFRTEGWDMAVMTAFDAYLDSIVFVHGDDGFWGDRFGTHGFIHRKWAETVGYFVPPYFSSDFNDTWLNDVANALGRRKYINILTEHMHFAFGKGPLDQTHQERLERHVRDNVDQLYADKRPERDADVEKLRKVMI